DDALRGALALDDVAVQPADAEAGEPVADLALDPLRAPAEVADPRRAAVRAAGRHRPGPAAVMAAQGAAGLVVDERAGAVRARRDVPAVATQHHRRRAAAVDDEDRLLAFREIREGRGEGAREHAEVSGRQLGAKVDDLDRRRRPAQPDRQPEPLDL